MEEPGSICDIIDDMNVPLADVVIKTLTLISNANFLEPHEQLVEKL